MRSRDYSIDRLKIKTLMKNNYKREFAPLLEMCPHLDVILAHMKIKCFGLLVQDVDWTSDMTDWSEEDCKRVGRSIVTLLHMVQTGEGAVASRSEPFAVRTEDHHIHGIRSILQSLLLLSAAPLPRQLPKFHRPIIITGCDRFHIKLVVFIAPFKHPHD